MSIRTHRVPVHPDGALDLHALAAAPPWSHAETAALDGRFRGQLMHAWADNLRRRGGDAALEAVRRRLGSADALPDAPAARDWLPVSLQLRAAEAIADRLCGGDLLGLYPMLLEDTLAALPRGARFALRGLGARRVLGRASSAHPRLYDVGRLDVELTARRAATLRFTGAALFAHPTWRVLQALAVRMVFELLGKARTLELAGRGCEGDGFELELAW